MTPIAPLITRFLREHLPIERGYSPHTCETYAHAFRLLFAFASRRLGIKPSKLCLEQIDAAMILDFLAYIEDQRGNCAATRATDDSPLSRASLATSSCKYPPPSNRRDRSTPFRRNVMIGHWCDI